MIKVTKKVLKGQIRFKSYSHQEILIRPHHQEAVFLSKPLSPLHNYDVIV